MLCGIPQRSLLGPLLLILFINDINLAVPYSNICLFTDDDASVTVTRPHKDELEASLVYN